MVDIIYLEIMNQNGCLVTAHVIPAEKFPSVAAGDAILFRQNLNIF